MNVEVRGVGTVNKGAYLMLKAIDQELKQGPVNAKLVSKQHKNFTKESITALGYGLKISNTGIKAKILSGLPKFIRNGQGLFFTKDIDVCLDASGFLYGDKWTAKSIKNNLSDDIDLLKKQGTKVVLMPQAFGPFEKNDIRKEVKHIIDTADLVFARDKVSYEYLKDIASKDNNHIFLAPDFTNMLDVSNIKIDRDFSKDVFIIPNRKLLENIDREKYISFLTECVNIIKANALTPIFLIHEGEQDLEIARQVNNGFNSTSQIEILEYDDPLMVKAIIGKAYFIITGRFHGLVSSLSQNIPSLATSWSHKYEMLLEDYDSKDNVLDMTGDKAYLETALAPLISISGNRAIREKLTPLSIQQKKRSRLMWDKLYQIVK